MAKLNKTKLAVSKGLYSTFRAVGYDGATLVALSQATGLGKASLYYHFPGGKKEMAVELLRSSVAELNQLAFRHLGKKKKTPSDRLQRFLSGFSDYVSQGEENCLAAMFVLGGERSRFQDSIKQQSESWLAELGSTYSETGLSDKKAHRKALEMFTSLHGALCVARMLDDPGVFQQTVNRLSKSLANL